jgi:putative transposase
LSYQGRKAAKEAPVVERMKELSAQYPRYGYRRIRIFLGRDGYCMSPGRAHSERTALTVALSTAEAWNKAANSK